jgi:hypothetical protein
MKTGAWSLLAIDAVGGAVTALILGLGAWYILPEQGGGADDAQQLAGVIAGAKSDLANLRSVLDEQKALAVRYQSELAAAGAMPSQTPQETHLRTLSGLAAANHLGVVRQLPLSPREYPGLMEQRFAYEVTGTMPDLARFFKAVESSPSWTDISYLKIDQGKGTGSTTDRSASLTFSVFSMAKNQPTSAGQGG